MSSQLFNIVRSYKVGIEKLNHQTGIF